MSMRYVNAMIEDIRFEGESKELLELTFTTEAGMIKWHFGMRSEIDQWVVSKMMRCLFNVVDEEDMRGFHIQLALDGENEVVGIGDIIKDVVYPCNPMKDGFMQRAYTKKRFQNKYQK